MAAVNSVQSGLHLPLTGLAPPRVLMCSASMGAEGSVTLQLREAVQAPESGNSLDTALTIGYPDPEILADVLGTLQAAGLSNNNSNTVITNNRLTNSKNHSISSVGSRVSSGMTNNTIHKNNNCNNTSSSSCTENSVSVQNPPIIVKKSRPKTSSPTRHGPQQCQVCSKIFGNASALAKHKLTHSDERKYVCAMCSKAFKRQDHLNGHMLTHRNKKPYECKAEGCGKSYCDARSLRRHTENHHSSLAMTPTTPNQSPSTGPPTGLSLSPATASGDASSPHGATCIQYINSGDTTNSKPSSPSSPAGVGNEGLTRQQLDLISQIMQQTKQTTAQVTVSTNTNGIKNHQRPRTWNMQTQLQQNQSTLSPNSSEPVSTVINTATRTSAGSSQSHHQGNHTQTQQSQTHSHALNIIKVDQKPVECNLCHRKFKNIPALNGHMRLHGGYFKKDTETKKCEKKEAPGPPLQTASIGVRALIEEKIISRRSKDLKGAFVVPAPPLAAVRREIENFLSPKIPSVVSSSNSLTGTVTNIFQTSTLQQKNPNINSLTTIHNAPVETKDATLIELLKRGTKVAVKRTCSDPGHTFSNNPTSSSALLPSDPSISAPNTPNPTPPLAISLPNETTPLALTISQAPNGTGDVYTLTYSTDSTATFFGDNDVYSVSDTAMLLQAVDSIQLLNDSTTTEQLDQIASLSEYSLGAESIRLPDGNNITKNYTPNSKQLQAVLNSPLPESLAEFSALHSKDYVLYNCTNDESPLTQSSASPLPSPLAYPTPPASHEAVAQASPYLDDSHHFSDANSFFDEKTSTAFIDENNGQFFKNSVDSDLTENEKILKLKNELFNESKSVLEDTEHFFKTEDNSSDVFDSEVKVEDLLNETNSEQCDLKDFTHQNLSFLDETHNFLDDTRNASSPLSASFFTSAISSAEDVKEVLKDVLPNNNLNNEPNCENDIDLYYLPGLTLQSQMMPNSDDPLLSSSPKDFVQRVQPHQLQQQQQEFVIVNKYEDTCSYSVVTPKKPRSSDDDPTEHTQLIQRNNLTEQFMNSNLINNSVASNISSKISPNQMSSILKKRPTPKKLELFRSKLRKPTTTHYTPPPMLNPDRKAPGLYSSLPKTLIQESIDLADDFDDNTNLTAFLHDSKVNIGTAYQASISNSAKDYDYKMTNYEELMWNPTTVDDDKLLIRFIELSKSSAVPLGFHSEEVSLKALLQAQGDTHVAVLNLLQSPSSAVHLKWMSYEIETFLKGLEKYGKDFYTISKEVSTKSTSECIQLYYFWKKLCVDYKTTHLKQGSFDIEDHAASHSSQSEIRPHVCEMPDCSASFTSKAALHGHTRIHCIGKNMNQVVNGQMLQGTGTLLSTTVQNQHMKDDFPCKVCGKVFNKVKSRSAHMKSHRPQENDINPNV